MMLVQRGLFTVIENYVLKGIEVAWAAREIREVKLIFFLNIYLSFILAIEHEYALGL